MRVRDALIAIAVVTWWAAWVIAFGVAFYFIAAWLATPCQCCGS